MSVLIPRIRTIGVRLSEDEYSSLEKFCAENGARSISDLARAAIYGFLNRANQENTLASTVDQHTAQVKELETKIERLLAEMASLRMSAFPVEDPNSTDSQEAKEDSQREE